MVKVDAYLSEVKLAEMDLESDELVAERNLFKIKCKTFADKLSHSEMISERTSEITGSNLLLKVFFESKNNLKTSSINSLALEISVIKMILLTSASLVMR
ncbi:hypothetical protein WICPIJ_008914 [Wickerhamomyces pijperi]|uniref:Uncharacterized protein n=1 Tax=Wickerhamomyces pijperi TaxID=599730 RepID=A0A9P8PVT0_WICPI|nr:hypothetical protein WICPIJ_008914 [Wickerhamomyces pijperi]